MRIRNPNDEPQSSTADQNFDMMSIVEALNGYASKEISKLLKDSDNFTIQLNTQGGSLRQVDVEKLANSLTLHLVAVLLSSDYKLQPTHLLRGVRLLHTLSEVASRHSRLEQILLDDVKASEQLVDLVFFMLIILAQTEQDYGRGTQMSLLHPALVACTLHLLTCYVSSQLPELVHALLAHPKVEIFMDVAFDAVHANIRLLDAKLFESGNDILCKNLSISEAEKIAIFICQQCEASLQFLLLLCQQKSFRDRLLKNKELCRTGGVLSLCHTTLKLTLANGSVNSVKLVAALSRLQSKALSILVQLCEAESVSYLDEIVVSSKSMLLAKSVALMILNILRNAFGKEAKHSGLSTDRSNPKGLLLLNSLRLADIYSDDSNFRSFFMSNAIQVLIEVLGISHEEFRSNWCSVDSPITEEDSNLEYDPFTAAGMAILLSKPDISSDETNFVCKYNLNGALPSTTYAQQKTSNLVKIIANLHCFVPNICEEEERDLFLKKFNKALYAKVTTKNDLNKNIQEIQLARKKVKLICENLSELSVHASSLIPNLLNNEDIELVSVFTEQLKKLDPPKMDECDLQGVDTKNVGSAPCKMEDPFFHQSLLNWTIFSNPDCSRMESTDHVQDRQNTLQDTSLSFKKDVLNSQEETPRFEESNQIITSKTESPMKESYTEHPRSYILEATISGVVNRKCEEEESLSKRNVDMLTESKEMCAGSSVHDDDKVDIIQTEEKQPRKRKRNIMSEKQINLIENALLNEPDLQKNTPALQSWSETLSSMGSEITASQLKNWLNNRKAKLARLAALARESSTPSEGENKTSGPTTSHFHESPDSEELYTSNILDTPDFRFPPAHHIIIKSNPNPNLKPTYPSGSNGLKPGQFAVVLDAEGNEIGKGKVFQVEGRWQGSNLEEVGVCIVDITELKVDKGKEVQYPPSGGGKTFEDAMARNGGVARVAWDVVRVQKLHL